MAAKLDPSNEDEASLLNNLPHSNPLALTGHTPAERIRNIRFWTLVVGILFFFGCHNYMQELIMSLPGFKVCISHLILCFENCIFFFRCITQKISCDVLIMSIH